MIVAEYMMPAQRSNPPREIFIGLVSDSISNRPAARVHHVLMVNVS